MKEIEIGFLKGIKGGDLVEFYVCNEGEDYVNWHKDSQSLKDVVFAVFSDCFIRSHDKFDYYGDTLYGRKELPALGLSLKKFSDSLDSLRSAGEMYEFISSAGVGRNFFMTLDHYEIDWKNDWKDILNKLKKVNQGLISIVTECIDTERVLWVLGV